MALVRVSRHPPSEAGAPLWHACIFWWTTSTRVWSVTTLDRELPCRSLRGLHSCKALSVAWARPLPVCSNGGVTRHSDWALAGGFGPTPLVAQPTIPSFSLERCSCGHDCQCPRTFRGHDRDIQQRGTVRISWALLAALSRRRGPCSGLATRGVSRPLRCKDSYGFLTWCHSSRVESTE